MNIWIGITVKGEKSQSNMPAGGSPLKGAGVTVNTVSPGIILVDNVIAWGRAKFGNDSMSVDEVTQAIAAAGIFEMPTVGRLGSPEDVALIVATLAVLGTLAVFALMMPNFTDATRGPDYAPIQLLVVGAVSLALYIVFVFVQTVRHREYFMDEADETHPGGHSPSRSVAAASTVLLILSLTAVVVLAKVLSEPLTRAVQAAGLPAAFVGVVIASIVLLPEGIAAMKAALQNRLQGSINLALGSAVASIGLTIPTVALVSLIFDLPLVLGLTDENMVLLMLTLFAATLTLGTGRTTVLQGAVHLVIFSVFLLLSVIP